MKICLILEGCYPYVRGGVSAWAHQYMTCSPDIEFVLWTIHASEADTREMLYELPENVVAHHRVYLDRSGNKHRKKSKPAVVSQAVQAIGRILQQQQEGWTQLMDLIPALKGCSDDVTSSPEFLDLARTLSEQTPRLSLSDAFYSLRSMFQPIAGILAAPVPEADIYHSAVAGYGGLLAALAAHTTGKPMILTEHGIYPREREEELLSADWAVRDTLPLWTQLFYDMSRCAYRHAAKVTSLFEGAAMRQVSIGCEQEKCTIIPNGIRCEEFNAVAPPPSGKVLHIGAFVRFAAIKDIKTMIHAFALLHAQQPDTVLHLMGGTDDEDYRNGCISLIHRLRLDNCISVDGHVNAVQAMHNMDITLLTSISEGQPLTLLESMAAGRPCVATRVGNCVGLLEMPMNGIGAAGICCTPMSPDEIASALEKLCVSPALRAELGKNGRLRVAERYMLPRMLNDYHQLYEEVKRHGGNRI